MQSYHLIQILRILMPIIEKKEKYTRAIYYSPNYLILFAFPIRNGIEESCYEDTSQYRATLELRLIPPVLLRDWRYREALRRHAPAYGKV